MKKQVHPPYQAVLFIDSTTNAKFLCYTTLQSKETEMYEGKEYPVHRVSTSSDSHPFFTGSTQFIDTEGRVDKFLKRYTQAKPKSAPAAEAKEAPKKSGKPTKK